MHKMYTKPCEGESACATDKNTDENNHFLCIIFSLFMAVFNAETQRKVHSMQEYYYNGSNCKQALLFVGTNVF